MLGRHKAAPLFKPQHFPPPPPALLVEGQLSLPAASRAAAHVPPFSEEPSASDARVHGKDTWPVLQKQSDRPEKTCL